MKHVLIVAACVALFNPASLLYAQCYLVSALLNGSKSPLEIVRQQPAYSPLQAQLQNANLPRKDELVTASLELK